MITKIQRKYMFTNLDLSKRSLNVPKQHLFPFPKYFRSNNVLFNTIITLI